MLIDRLLSLYSPSHSKDSDEKEESIAKTSIFFKFCLQIIMLFLILFFVGMISPLRGDLNLQYKCMIDTNRQSICFYIIYNGFLKGFYILYSIYFMIGAFQLKYGLRKYKKRNTLLNNYNLFNYTCFMIYRAIPFIFEMKTILDWTIKKTSLSLFQWLKLEDIHAKLYASKMESISRKNREVGQKIDLIIKFFLGVCLLLILLILIFGPMLIFSSLNPGSKLNYVNGGSIEFGIKVDNMNYYKIFESSHVGKVSMITDKEYKDKNLENSTLLHAINRDRMQVSLKINSSL